MSRLLIALMLRAGIAYGPAGEGGGGAAAGAGAGAGGDAGGKPGAAGAGGSGGSDGEGDADGDGTGADGDGSSGDDDAGGNDGGAEKGDKGKADPDGEYVDDPTKTPEENAAAKAEHDAAKEARAALFGKPEKYADIQVPEGMLFDQDGANALHALAAELDLSQTAVDRLLALNGEVQARIGQAMAKQAADDLAASQADWLKDLRRDKVLGGKDHDAKLAKATEARLAFADQEYNDWLEASGLANFPPIVRQWYAVGEAMGEMPTLRDGGGQGKGDTAQDKLNRLYKPRAKRGAKGGE
jgi:hypothetical protein